MGEAAYGSPRNAKPPGTATPRTAPPSITTTGLLGMAEATTGVAPIVATATTASDTASEAAA
jgi:hypothetical protein